ncbi:hypothetical protein [Roseomonas sp. WA12]
MQALTTPLEIKENDIVAGTGPRREVIFDLTGYKGPVEILAALRRAYNLGRRDQREETGAILRGIMA